MADTPKTPAELAEQLLQAMKIVSDSSLNQISFDKTEICTILSKENESANNNCYFVTNGSMRFKAYVPPSTDGKQVKYKKDDSVRVSIPNGDYTKKKIIEGLSVDENNDNPTIFVSPLDTMLEVVNDILPTDSANQTYGLVANGDTEDICIWSADFDNDIQYRDIQNNDICDTIGLKADFKTVFANSNVIKGHYGLRLDLYFHTADNDGDEFYNVNQHSVYLDSANMFGNPYSFLIYSTQAIKFSIKDFGILKGANLYFYQKKDFERLNDKGIKETVPSNVLDNNLLVKNLYLSFGSNTIDMDNGIFKIFSNDKLTYNEDNNPTSDSVDDYKELGLLWYNTDDNGKYIGFSDGIYDEDYDEIEYIKSSSADARLLAQKGRECPNDLYGLTLSANLEDEKKLYNEIYGLINRDLYNDLKAFANRFQGAIDAEKEIAEAFDNILTNKDGGPDSLGEFLIDFEKRQKLVETQYTEILKFAKKWQNAKLLGEEKPKLSDYNKIVPEYIQNYNPEKDNVCADINGYIADRAYAWVQRLNPDNPQSNYNLFGILSKYVTGDYQSFKSIYDSFVNRFRLIYKKIYDATVKIEKLVLKEDNTSLDIDFLNNYITSEDYIFNEYSSTIEEEKEKNNNKYCIYWYRYSPNAEEIDAEPRILDKKWKRIISNDKINGHNITNLGIPNYYIVGEDSKYYNEKRDTNEILGINLDTTAKTEKIKAVLFYNHTKYESNEIEFTNANPYTEQDAADQNGALYIEHGENSKSSYQLYGINNYLVNASDIQKIRNLKIRFDGKQGKDEYLNDKQIFWYLPKNSTMLTYSLEDFNSDFSNDINDEVKSDTSIDGYYCFYRTINENEESRLFPYRISNYYSSSFSQNEILCKVKPINSDITYEANIVFTFSSYGTSGTDYTLVVTPTDFKSAITEEVDSEGCNLKLSVSLYDYKNEKIDLPNSFECSWIGGNKLSPYVDVPLSSDTFGIQAITSGQNATLGKANFYGVLKTTLEVLVQENEEDAGRTVELSTVTTIPYSSGDYYIEGPDIIVYNSLGTDASYYKDRFKIFDKNTKKELTNVNWFMWYYKENGSATATAKDLKADDDYKLIYNFMPKLKEDNTLSVSNMFFDSSSGSSKNLYPLVVCKNYNGTILWAQPIYLMQNRYPSSMLNSWNGEFKIDEENGTIMSTMLGAGRKNSLNEFEGILMGDIAGVPGGDTDAIGLGLYGYNRGAQSFRFGIDGKAFIGKAGHGRIKFDGTTGTITSASYEQNNGCGIKIDLDDGLIDIRGAKKSGTSYENKNSRILLQVLDPYFQITSEAGKKIMQIGSENYYLQSDNYESNKSGMKINLKDGKIDAYNLKVTSKNLTLDSSGGTNYFVVKDDSGNVLFNASNSNFYLQSSNYDTTKKTGMKINLQTGVISTGSGNFSINSSGILTASGATITGNATISGKITATELWANTKGSIAGWDISTTRISKDNVYIDSKEGISSTDSDGGIFKIGTDGSIFSTKGTIGGWEISDTCLKAYRNVTDEDGKTIKKVTALQVPGTNTCAIAVSATAGTDWYKTAQFYVKHNGYMHASDGDIGGFSINKSSLSSSNIKINSENGFLTIEPKLNFTPTFEEDATSGTISYNPSGGLILKSGSTFKFEGSKAFGKYPILDPDKPNPTLEFGQFEKKNPDGSMTYSMIRVLGQFVGITGTFKISVGVTQSAFLTIKHGIVCGFSENDDW